MLLRPAYLRVTNALALLRLLPISDRDMDVEILALRHQATYIVERWSPVRARSGNRIYFLVHLPDVYRAVHHRLRGRSRGRHAWR